VMYAGRIVEDAAVGRLVRGPAHPYTAALLACSPELGRPEKSFPVIPGQPPTADARPRGCSFAERCSRAQSACRQSEPALTTHAEGHRVRCLHPLNGTT
jgi:peptide/nickel transport system permease protein